MFRYLETAQDVLDRAEEMITKHGATLVGGSLNLHYQTVTYKLQARNSSMIKLTNNALYSKRVSMGQIEKKLEGIENYKTSYDEFVEQIPKNTSFEIDYFFRQFAMLPAGWYRPNIRTIEPETNTSYHKYDKVAMIDINKCYTHMLAGRKIPIIDLDSRKEYRSINKAIEDLNKESSELFVVLEAFNVTDKKPEMYPLQQPAQYDELGLTSDNHNTGSTISTSSNNAYQVIYLHSYNIGEVFNAIEYFNTKYQYDEIKYKSIVLYKHGSDSVEFPMEYKAGIDEVYRKTIDVEDSYYRASAKHHSKMIVGKLFQKLTMVNEDDDTYSYQLNGSLKSFILNASEKKPRKISANRITVVPLMYSIINVGIRNLFRHIPFDKVYKLTADSITVSQSAQGLSEFDYGIYIGQVKLKKADHIRIYNNRHYVMYNKNNSIVSQAIGGLSLKIMPYLNTMEDWLDRYNMKDKHGIKYFRELFDLEKYSEEMQREQNQNFYNYKNLSECAEARGFNVLAPQGTGKTTSIVKHIKKHPGRTLHIFYNRTPAEQNALAHNSDQLATPSGRPLGHHYRVVTMDSLLMGLYYTKHDYKNSRQSWDTVRQYFLSRPEELFTALEDYDNIVLDEVQSFYGYLAEIAKLIMTKYASKVIVAGDFNQQFDKIHRGDNPMTFGDLPKAPTYTLNINYRNSKEIQDYASEYMDFNTECGNTVEGKISIEHETLEAIVEAINKADGYHIICRTDKGRAELRKAGVTRKIYSVSQSLSMSPDKVLLVNSTRISINEDKNEAMKEILCAVMRGRYELKIMEEL